MGRCSRLKGTNAANCTIENKKKKSDRVLAGSFNQRATQYPESYNLKGVMVYSEYTSKAKAKKGMTSQGAKDTWQNYPLLGDFHPLNRTISSSSWRGHYYWRM